MQPTTVAICVPVRNEEARLPSLLDALAAQRSVGIDLVACFFLDACRDRSEAVLRAAVPHVPFALRIEAGTAAGRANAGRARRAAMALGLDHLAGRDAALLSTDADSAPAPDWVAASCRALRIADVAVGTLVRAERHAMQERVEAYYDRLHRYRRLVDPVEWDANHARHFGGAANLAIRVATYRALGGFAAVPAGEDAALLDDAARAGFRVRRDPAMVVETSSRRHGRAPGGFAAALAELDRAGLPTVAHPAAAAWQYRAHARARAAFAGLHAEPPRHRLGTLLGLTGDHVLGVARDCPNAEAFAMRVVPGAPDGERRVPLAEAEAALADLELGVGELAA